jgi:hypothetical protein
VKNFEEFWKPFRAALLLMAQRTGLQDDHESHWGLAKRLPRIPASFRQGPTARGG